jgi:histidine phosphotransferase ChpT
VRLLAVLFTGDAIMSVNVALDPLDLAALLCSRVCHDLISPTGAIVNGLEVLEERESDEETRKFALDLIKKSAKTVSTRLQFCRLAFGSAGSAGAQIDLDDAQSMARAFIEDGKTRLVWNLPRALSPKNRVKLLLNMLILAVQTIPRGGTLTIDPVGEGEMMGFRIGAVGLNARIPQKMSALLDGKSDNGLVDAHAIQPLYAGLLARACGLKVNLNAEGDTIVVATSTSEARSRVPTASS